MPSVTYVHEPSGHGYVVRERDAHAWCLVWNEQTQDLAGLRHHARDLGRGGRQTRVGHAMAFGLLFVGAISNSPNFAGARRNLRQYLLWALVPVLSFLLYQIIFRRGASGGSKSQEQ